MSTWFTINAVFRIKKRIDLGYLADCMNPLIVLLQNGAKTEAEKDFANNIIDTYYNTCQLPMGSEGSISYTYTNHGTLIFKGSICDRDYSYKNEVLTFFKRVATECEAYKGGIRMYYHTSKYYKNEKVSLHTLLTSPSLYWTTTPPSKCGYYFRRIKCTNEWGDANVISVYHSAHLKNPYFKKDDTVQWAGPIQEPLNNEI